MSAKYIKNVKHYFKVNSSEPIDPENIKISLGQQSQSENKREQHFNKNEKRFGNNEQVDKQKNKINIHFDYIFFVMDASQGDFNDSFRKRLNSFLQK